MDDDLSAPRADFPLAGRLRGVSLYLVKVSLACLERVRAIRPASVDWLVLVESPAQVALLTSDPDYFVHVDAQLAAAGRL